MSYYDFANKQHKEKKSSKHWVLIVALAVAAMGLWLLKGGHKKKTHAVQHKVAAIKLPAKSTKLPLPAATKHKATQKSAAAPKLEFYQLLKSPTAKAHMLPAPHSQYSLQVAALASHTDAEQLVHELKSHALSAHIVNTNNGSRTHWNRVLMGPYKNSKTALADRNRLQKMGRHGVLLISQH